VLRYCNAGPRDYAARRVYPTTRTAWEFEAAVSGRCAPLLPAPARAAMRSRTLWIFPPDSAHGWTSVTGEPCDIVVLQFPEVPEPVASLARREGYLAIPLNASDCRRLRVLAERGLQCMDRPDEHSHLHEQGILIELCLLAVRGRAARPLAPGERSAETVCDNALAWYAARLREAPSAEAVAAAVHVSPAHLRRLFHQCKGLSPQAALRRLRIRQAEDLLLAGLGQSAIAEACGFAGPAALSRAFRAVHGRPPGAWLRRLPKRG